MKRERLQGTLQANTKLSSHSFKISPKIHSIDVVQLHETWGKMSKCSSVLISFLFLNNFWRYLCCLSTCRFYAQPSSSAKKQRVCNHKITAHLTTRFFLLLFFFSDFLYFRYFKALLKNADLTTSWNYFFLLNAICVFNSADEKK